MLPNLNNITKNKDIFYAWCAGFFDGEGCVYIEQAKQYSNGKKTELNYYRVRVHLSQNIEQIVLILKDNFGGSVFRAKYKQKLLRPMYAWVGPTNEGSTSFLKKILPYLLVKRKQAELAIKFVDYLNSKNSTQEGKQEFKTEMSRLNNLPVWEP